ncbi:GTP 3',8-cyclase MoaA [Sphingosinicella rhizophila]|uniref:GTP 3',8-cyclase n=1 Tax=Sphingosinicella rhizophila TaxID=3050082 RepID=A0ABU3Q5V4_9SPHN|nr:GTP 3',8-cyclase MoaA [Sphingosinicella sp. GR2756]MDT9598793.1 GTP 3',8-cyclase MoaA [Sphingosinicella sp. GR2756]
MSDKANLVDSFGRRIDYVRLSVTDRCDLRCRYCMAEKMEFLPRKELLTLEELAELAAIFVRRGVRKIRLTGGEPLVRRNIVQLVGDIAGLKAHGLDEITLTTNGTQLGDKAEALRAAGIRRINVSLDSLDPDRFAFVTRRGSLDQVLAGLDAARAAGLSVKINMVALKGVNDAEFAPMVRWCGHQGFDLCLIETMPLGWIDEDRADRYLPLDGVKAGLDEDFTLLPSLHRSGGPARYFDVQETGRRIGFITPLSNNFCAGCNRIRVTATGTIYGCLGHDQKVELRDIFRSHGAEAVDAALDVLLAGKPEKHDFAIARAEPAVLRHMNVTGG